jgi:hypothetical protein
MNFKRRDFLGAGLGRISGQGATAESPGPQHTDEIPTREAKVVRVFKSPDEDPNALEAISDALWVGGQLIEIA